MSRGDEFPEFRGAVVIMAKAPREGTVKTRLNGAFPLVAMDVSDERLAIHEKIDRRFHIRHKGGLLWRQRRWYRHQLGQGS